MGRFQIGGSTLTALNSNVTRTDAASLYLGGPPTAGTNITITHPWNIWSNSGYSYFNNTAGGGIYIGGTNTRNNKPPFSLSIEGQSALGSALSSNNFSSSAYQLILGSGSGNNGMTIFSGNDSTGNIYFADSNTNDGNNRIGQLVYNHSTNRFSFTANAQSQLSFGPGNGFIFNGYFGQSVATLYEGYFQLYDQRVASGISNMSIRAGTVQGNTALFDWRDNSNNVLGVISSSGNIGVGTTNPVATLDINGTAKLKKYTTQPFACDATHDGTTALTGTYRTCVCNGGTTTWVYTSDGSTTCVWQ